ncbi:MAG: hypothetical protein R2788_21735 [Saprospiraceae bacterium]
MAETGPRIIRIRCQHRCARQEPSRVTEALPQSLLVSPCFGSGEVGILENFDFIGSRTAISSI